MVDKQKERQTVDGGSKGIIAPTKIKYGHQIVSYIVSNKDLPKEREDVTFVGRGLKEGAEIIMPQLLSIPLYR